MEQNLMELIEWVALSLDLYFAKRGKFHYFYYQELGEDGEILDYDIIATFDYDRNSNTFTNFDSQYIPPVQDNLDKFDFILDFYNNYTQKYSLFCR